mmetsp:Transcript_6240/g.13619  ORF Transcript_6240/g.13619 Transcript_6240/m.13619 type:complete len:542 (+) Transcript_6240:154-1779(+)|eukprot:CAMPEP_0171364340 /NCGR_PEP_ID=MMETSP0879-20121228/3979_1 /TAXON_ID=67004 /ORGANISM="Thalassiosira weissflogii, Strain CCMP1336" /LENGTH=541 /DNA_ID=CAMNT_0011871709 /DNA_START=91 /DNA_END=1716 /DNA_ORIENTATION=+
MVLTDKQRTDLHAGIYEYLLSRGPAFAATAEALAQADPEARSSNSSTDNSKTDGNDDEPSNSNGTSPRKTTPSSATPVLEKKWTAVPRLQKRVLELERQISSNQRIHAHRAGFSGGTASAPLDSTTASGGIRERRMLPRPPAQHSLQSHSSGITALALHPIYTLAASGSEDGTIKLWDHESGDYLRTLRGHTNVVTSVDFCPKGGGYLVSCSTDLSIKIWDVKDNFVCVRTLRGHDHTISCVRFVPPPLGAVFLEGGKIGSVEGGGAEAAAGGGASGTIDPAEAGAKFIVSASRDNTVKFWDLETGFCDHTIEDHSDWVRCIAVRAASAVVSKGGGGANAGGGAAGGEASDPASEGSGAGRSLASNLALVATSGNDRTIYVYDANDKRTKVAELRGHDHVVEALSFLCSSALPQKAKHATPSSKLANNANDATSNTWDYLASASRDRTVRLWTVANGGSCISVFRAHENWVRGVVLHPSGNHILSCGDDRSIRVFDVKANRCLRTIEDAHAHFVTAIAMHPTLPIMVSGGVDHVVKCWQLD